MIKKGFVYIALTSRPNSILDASIKEIMAQHAGNGNYDSPYHFNAKEVDPETGYHYYGARYYNSNLSVWLSVDPMASERSWLTPYNFSAKRSRYERH